MNSHPSEWAKLDDVWVRRPSEFLTGKEVTILRFQSYDATYNGPYEGWMVVVKDRNGDTESHDSEAFLQQYIPKDSKYLSYWAVAVAKSYTDDQQNALYNALRCARRDRDRETNTPT